MIRKHPILKTRVIEILTVAAHCNDRTYGEVADEIISLFDNHSPNGVGNQTGFHCPYCGKHYDDPPPDPSIGNINCICGNLFTWKRSLEQISIDRDTCRYVFHGQYQIFMQTERAT
jgi:hypothetical protein